jgi:hypothetical protein
MMLGPQQKFLCRENHFQPIDDCTSKRNPEAGGRVTFLNLFIISTGEKIVSPKGEIDTVTQLPKMFWEGSPFIMSNCPFYLCK